jgi:hypothetical protein
MTITINSSLSLVLGEISCNSDPILTQDFPKKVLKQPIE